MALAGEQPDRLPHDGEMDWLTVQIPRAKRLLPMDKAGRGEEVGSSDPYARLVYDDSEGKRQRVQTQAIEKTLRPQWIERPDDCTFALTVLRGVEMELTVWDKDALTDDLIGGALISTVDCFSEPGTMWSGWVELFTQVGRKSFLPGQSKPKTSLGKKAGEVFVTLQWSGIPEKRAAHLAAGGLPAETDEPATRQLDLMSGALFTANAVKGMHRTERRVKTPPVRPALGRGMAARLGCVKSLRRLLLECLRRYGYMHHLTVIFILLCYFLRVRCRIAYGVTAQIRSDFDEHLLPAGQCAAPLREVLWSLLRYVLAGAPIYVSLTARFACIATPCIVLVVKDTDV
jgi:hypothetical protein